MNKLTLLTAVVAAVGLTSTEGLAKGNSGKSMEKCTVVKDGKGLIKAHKGECKGANHSCAGQNAAGEVDSWILVPTGECSKINAGNFKGIAPDILDNIEGAGTAS